MAFAVAVFMLLFAAKDELLPCLIHHEGKTHEPKTLILMQLVGLALVLLSCVCIGIELCGFGLLLLSVHSHTCVCAHS